MTSTPNLLTDPDRLAALRATGLLNPDPKPTLQRLTRLASRFIGAPVSLVSLVHGDRQVFAAEVGVAEPWKSRGGTPLSYSFCQHVVTSGEALIVPNTRLDPRVSENPAIDELGVEAYAGVPLQTSEGHRLGSFCVIDDHPRAWTDDELEVLHDLAAAAMTEIELRATATALDDALASVRTLKGLIPVCSWCSKIRDDEGFWNGLVKYMARHTGVQVSHGICPSCEQRLETEVG